MKFIKIINQGKQTKKRNKIWVVAFGLLGVILLVQLVVINTLAGKGQELATLQVKAIKLSQDNQSLLKELSQKTSLVKISTKASELGLVKPENIVYFDMTSPVAALPQ